MYKNSQITVIIPAAGKGSRMGMDINKQYIELAGIPILARTLMFFDKSIFTDNIILVVNKEDIDYCNKEIVGKYKISKVKAVIAGGRERQESCRNGIEAAAKVLEVAGMVEKGLLILHDGVRPFVTEDIFENVLAAVEEWGAACACVSVKDTVKIVGTDNLIVDTPERSNLYNAQTPQGFKFDYIEDAYKKAEKNGYNATDDSALAEHYGYKVKIVNGSYENIKITTKEDLDYARYLFEEQIVG